MTSRTRAFGFRAFTWGMAAALLTTSCGLAPMPTPVSGLPQFQGFGVVGIPGGLYNVAGTNLMIQRADVSVDTRILAGTAVGATYNSAAAAWHWSYEMRVVDGIFVDREGAAYDVGSLALGSAIPGTHWVRVDSDTLETKGGLAFDFDAAGRLDAVYWRSDPYPRYRYVHASDSVEQRECLLPTTPIEQCRLMFTVHLGPHGPERIVDEDSASVGVTREAEYVYDVLGRLIVARTPFEVEEDLPGTRYEYASRGLMTASVDSEGARIEYRWAFGALIQVTQRGEGDPRHAFSPPQRVAEGSAYRVFHANPLGGVTAYTFSDAGQVTEIERVDAGEAMTLDWIASANRPSRIEGFDGAVHRLEDWVDDDATTLVEPSGNVVQLGYAPAGIEVGAPFTRPLASVSDSLGAVRTVTRDANGRPLSSANGEGEAVTWTYVGAEVSTTTAPWGAGLEFLSYGVHGHWRTAEAAQVEVPIQRKLDRIGNLLVPAAGFQEGGVLERAYDASRRLASLELGATDEMGVVTSTQMLAVTRRGDGRMLGVQRPDGADHAFVYDALGRVTLLRERVDGTWQDTRLEYDAAGNVTGFERPNGMREELDYDPYGRVIARRSLRGGVVEAHAAFEWSKARVSRWYDSVRDQWETFTYDAAGRPTRVVFSQLGESLSYDYDLRSRVVRKTFQFGSDVRVIETEWDLADRRTRVFTYDAAGVPRDLVRLDYQAGRLEAIEYGNGLRRENLFDPATGEFDGHRTTEIGSATVVEETTITREAKTGPTRLEVTSWTETPLATTQEQYWLGLGGNLQSLDRKIGARVFRWQGWTWIDGVLEDTDDRRYAWDALSNPVDDSDGDVFSYNAERNRLLAATVDGDAHTYSYDAAGFATSRDGSPITWTAAGRLSSFGPAGSPLVEIDWDLAGRPVSVSVLGATREFRLFGGLIEYDAASGEAGWLHLAHLSLPLVGDERIYRHVDGLGNVSFTTDASGAVTSHRRYQPFGLDRSYGGASFSDDEPRGFVGGLELQHAGAGTGLVVVGARILDSEVGRFLSQDPVFDLVSAYGYARGNPVQYEDSSGLFVDAKVQGVNAAALEAAASELDAEAAGLTSAASAAYTVAAVFGIVGVVNQAALLPAAAAALVGAKLSQEASAKHEQAALIRAQAAGIRYDRAIGELLSPVGPPGLRFGDCPWCDGLPRACGPPLGLPPSALRSAWLLALLLAVSSVLCLNGSIRPGSRLAPGLRGANRRRS